ncbi:MAG: DUF4433 domain-containing protein [Bryobacteraceae bacterium]|nr:DUF4433 domain-containing protein [Bryobacteraceae bacterium]
MKIDLAKEITARGITRLCHFTPSRNFGHILATGSGILSTKALQEDERAVYNQTDLQRLDSQPAHICCSIEYPNAWYLDRARAKERIFRDWLLLFLHPQLMLRKGTLFSARNAAAGMGAHLKLGVDGFQRMYADEVVGAYNRTFRRGPHHLSAAPTDQQAEVLIPDQVMRDEILGIAVMSKEQARNEVLRLSILGVSTDGLPIVIAPTLFDKDALNQSIRSGCRPKEMEFQVGDADGK